MHATSAGQQRHEAARSRSLPRGLNVVDPQDHAAPVRMHQHGLQANPFPSRSSRIVAYGLPRLQGVPGAAEIEARVENALQAAALWEEVKDRLNKPGYALSQAVSSSLCIALATDPRSCCSTNRPRPSTDRDRQDRGTRERTEGPRDNPHRHPQHAAGRPRQRLHRVHVHGRTDRVDHRRIFQNPSNTLTEQYISGRFG